MSQNVIIILFEFFIKISYLCSGLEGLPKWDFGILTTQNQ